MKIRVKLMGMLKVHTPEGGQMDLPEAATIGDVLAELQVDTKAIQAFSVNGSIQRDRDTRLSDNDELIVLPPVGGG